MKMKTALLLALSASTLSISAALDIGDSIVDADLKMKNTDGTMISFNDVKGEKGTLVIFTCNKCPFVEAWEKTMVELGNAYPKKGIGVIFVNSNDPAVKGDTLENMKAKAEKEGYQFPYVQDSTSEVAVHFGAKKTPDVFLFDAEGKLVYLGAVGDGGRVATDTVWLRDALDALIAGTEIKIPKTKAIGCTIKFR